MVTFDAALDLVLAEPFRPFRVRLADGRVFEIRDSSGMSVGVKSVTIHGRAQNDRESGLDSHHVEFACIQSIETTEMSTNGLGEPTDMFDRIFERMVAEPFRPFQIFLTDGRAFDIRLPHMIGVGVKKARISVAEPNDEGEYKIVHYDVPLTAIESVRSADISAVEA